MVSHMAFTAPLIGSKNSVVLISKDFRFLITNPSWSCISQATGIEMLTDSFLQL